MTPHPTYYEVVDRTRLKGWMNNPKLITEESVDQMVLLLQTHGFKDPVEARHEDGRVLAGHRRLLAADKLGLSLIPAIFHRGMTDEEATAYTIAHTQAEKHVGWNRALLADQITGLPESLSPDLLGFTDKDVASLFDLDRGMGDEGNEAEGVGDEGAGEPACGLIAGEQWIVGPVTFNVFKDLDEDGLRSAEKLIRKISRLVKSKALLDGDESRPLDAVLKERGMQA